jgi:RimJ/RimL family protein N-acetyltransferase
MLQAQHPEDLRLLTGAEAGFDDFGPRAVQSAPAPPQLDESGALTVVAADGAVAGDVSWHWRQWGPNRASWCPMIGIWLAPEFRGRGIGRAAQRQLAELFFGQTTVNRVEAHTDAENIAEQRALEAAGFQREGIIRGAQWRDGTYHDGYLYAVLRGEF